ncbi:SDR family oxidoreductase [Burkholderia sp. Ax-1719]|uniref:SDR family oxidoreductase n=1 Tax=Burkholderia sp. Ax-1719 TaxID=2608334 RepID=UPI00142126C0|nr:SDR family oxidoreductase [Burkholderia sp. Ax-1719]NIE63466.1 SDR family oxidoreductase [Burkholderia sp. Ax-1719]
MNILVCGAHGFIGSTVCEWLESHGHRVVKGVRHATQADEIQIDFAAGFDAKTLRVQLDGIDAVINSVGILLEHGEQTFDAVHTRSPIALFDACQQAGVKRVVQISALGVETGSAPYFTSKLAADRHLQSLPIDWQVVRPALVYGEHGTSSRFFRALASIPFHVLPAGGHQLLRHIHADDLAQAVGRLLEADTPARQTLDLVGGDEVEYREMLAIFRSALGFAPAPRISVPGIVIGATAAVFEHVPGSMLTRDTWRMLQSGSTADVADTAMLLGRMPRGIRDFIGSNALSLRREALDAWRSYVLRFALALTWIWSALASAWLHPQAQSLALLARVGLHGTAALTALYAASALDFVFGLATIFRPGRRLWCAQIALIVVYTAIIALALPELLTDPFGSILKNLPILALLLVLLGEEARS